MAFTRNEYQAIADALEEFIGDSWQHIEPEIADAAKTALAKVQAALERGLPKVEK
jgi:hypothetical protein